MESKEIDELKFVRQVREQMNMNKLMLAYRGDMSHDIALALLNLTESNLNLTDSDNPVKSRVFAVMVECLENITQHSEKNQHSRPNIFMIGQSETGFMIFSGNVIKTEKVDELKNKLLKINTLSEEELKVFYKYWITDEFASGKDGVGLGLVQIARKTGNQLEFAFEQIDSDNFFFSLKTIVRNC